MQRIELGGNSFAPVWFCYVYSMYTLYSCMPVVINVSSATAVNLSLLTADLYSLFCGLFLFQYTVTINNTTMCILHYERQVGCEVESQEKSQTDSSGKSLPAENSARMCFKQC
ncbi:solute carrier family 35 member F2, partial [Tachysurus ichikawai]